jgi:hypothetical protein
MSKRKYIRLTTKLASALCNLRDETGTLLIPYLDAKQMTEEQVLSLFNWDHNILHAIEVNDEHWNLTPTFIRPHRDKSKKDTSIVAKVKKLHANYQRSLATLMVDAAKDVLREEKPKFKRKIQSRGFEKKPKKKEVRGK